MQMKNVSKKQDKLKFVLFFYQFRGNIMQQIKIKSEFEMLI